MNKKNQNNTLIYIRFTVMRAQFTRDTHTAVHQLALLFACAASAADKPPACHKDLLSNSGEI